MRLCAPSTVVVLAGSAYVDAVRHGLRGLRSVAVEDPMRGMPIGRRIQWLDRHRDVVPSGL